MILVEFYRHGSILESLDRMLNSPADRVLKTPPVKKGHCELKLKNFDPEVMSSLLWDCKRLREQIRKERIQDVRVRQNLAENGDGWVNSSGNDIQNIAYNGERKDDRDDKDVVGGCCGGVGGGCRGG